MIILVVLLGFLALTFEGASAGEGTLIVNGRPYDDPYGCIKIGDDASPLHIRNQLNEEVWVFNSPDCIDQFTGIVHPGQVSIYEGASIYIP